MVDIYSSLRKWKLNVLVSNKTGIVKLINVIFFNCENNHAQISWLNYGEFHLNLHKLILTKKHEYWMVIISLKIFLFLLFYLFSVLIIFQTELDVLTQRANLLDSYFFLLQLNPTEAVQ